MKDPRAEVYAALEASENGALVESLKGYFEKMIGKDDALQNTEAVKAELEALKATHEALKAENETLKNAPAPTGDEAMSKELAAVRKDLDAIKKEKEDLIKSNNSTKLSESLGSLVGNVSPTVKSAIITALKSPEGYSIGGKTFKDSYDGSTMLIDRDGESLTSESGISELMESGLKDLVAGEAGGGFPTFTENAETSKLSLEESVNAVYKK